jgi:uncharacterized protein
MNSGSVYPLPGTHPAPRCIALFSAMFLPLFLNGFYNSHLVGSAVLYWSVEFCTWLLLPVILILVFKLSGGRVHDLGVMLPKSVKAWLVFISCSVAFSALFHAAFLIGSDQSRALFAQNYLAVNFTYRSIIPTEGIGKIVVWLYFSLTAGIVEELFFRGLLKRIFSNTKWGLITFVLTSTVLFASIHWENGVRDMFATGCVGLVASIAFLLNRNAITLMIAHTVTDLLLFW